MNADAEEILLDKTCANALNRWNYLFQDIITWSTESAHITNQKLRDDLASNRMPDYNDIYVPPAYVVRYQLDHTYTAKIALRHLDNFRAKHQNTLRIIDFGSGTSACRIAAAFMVADSLERENPLDAVEFVEIDNSMRMRLMGCVIWQEFTEIITSDYANTRLERAVKMISCRQVDRWNRDLETNEYAWLTALHAIYPHHYDLGAVVAQIYKNADPAMGVFTCNPKNLEDLTQAFPFVHELTWNKGSFPKFASKPDGPVKCRSFFTAQQARRFGFWRSSVRPFLQVKNCAVMWGSNNTSITKTPVSITIP